MDYGAFDFTLTPFEPEPVDYVVRVAAENVRRRLEVQAMSAVALRPAQHEVTLRPVPQMKVVSADGGTKMSETTPRFPIPNAYNPGFDVLIFSRDTSFVDHHRTILLSVGFVPIPAATLEEALAILRMTVIDLVIVDEETGVPETVRILERAKDGWRSIPVLVVSQGYDAELQRLAMEMGAAGYLDHPAFQDDVVRALLPNRDHTGASLWGPQEN